MLILNYDSDKWYLLVFCWLEVSSHLAQTGCEFSHLEYWTAWSHMCYKFTDFILHEGMLVSSSNYFTLFSMIFSFFDVIVVAVCQANSLWKFLRDLLQCFSGGSRQTLLMSQMRHLCYSTTRKVHFTLVLLRAKSFQIGLNHSCYVFGISSTLCYNISIYCISGLNCV